MSELFGVLEKEASEEQERTAGTRAVIAAQTRVRERFEKFLAGSQGSDEEFASKLALIDDEVRKIALDVCNEYGFVDSEKVYLASTVALGGGHAADCTCGFCENKGKLPGAKDDDGDDDEDDKKEAKTASVKTACDCPACKRGESERCEHLDEKEASVVAPREIPEFPWEHVAADTDEGDGYASERVDLPKADADGLGDTGAVPTDRSKSGDQTGWDLPPIEVPSNKHQKEEQSAEDRAEYNSEDFDPSNPIRDRVDADAPIQPEFNVAPNTETWSDVGTQAAPVTSKVAKWSVVD